MRLVRFLRLLEVEVLVTSMRLITHPLRAVPRTPQAPLTGQMANYNPRHGRNPYEQPLLVERRAGGQPTQRPGPARCGSPATLLLRTAEHGRHPRTCIKAVLGEVLLHKQQRQCVRVRRCHGPPSRRQSPLLHNSACVAGYLQNLQASAVRVLVVPLMRMPM